MKETVLISFCLLEIIDIIFILTDDLLTCKTDETFTFFKGVGHNELASETKFETKSDIK